MRTWRLLKTGFLPASLNMAIDEALFQLHVPGQSLPVLRFYSWEPPALSLGYFQRHSRIDLTACRKRGLDVVRRITGGRAVLHEQDLTYSVVADTASGIPSSPEGAYRLLCRGLLAGFRTLGFDAAFGEEEGGAVQEEICFARATAGDLVFSGRKFAGNAQTWLGETLLQHGSLVLEPQEETWAALLPTIPAQSLRRLLRSRTVSLGEILGRKIEPAELQDTLCQGMAAALNIQFTEDTLSAVEENLSRELAAAKDQGGSSLPPWKKRNRAVSTALTGV
jgi:lipoyl(octanoyl) transferase